MWERERERESVCVCVCEREREREGAAPDICHDNLLRHITYVTTSRHLGLGASARILAATMRARAACAATTAAAADTQQIISSVFHHIECLSSYEYE